MNADNSLFIENLLRRIYQTTENLPNAPVTTSDICELLEEHGHIIEPFNLNNMLEHIGFIGHPIPNQVDKLWLMVQQEIK